MTYQAAALVFQAEGYADGDLTLYHSFTVTAFLKAENAIDFMDKASEVRSLCYYNLSKLKLEKKHIFRRFIENAVACTVFAALGERC